jgi:hypothetical protein
MDLFLWFYKDFSVKKITFFHFMLIRWIQYVKIYSILITSNLILSWRKTSIHKKLSTTLSLLPKWSSDLPIRELILTSRHPVFLLKSSHYHGSDHPQSTILNSPSHKPKTHYKIIHPACRRQVPSNLLKSLPMNTFWLETSIELMSCTWEESFRTLLILNIAGL